jgi:superfamily II DNA or RNA helicase
MLFNDHILDNIKPLYLLPTDNLLDEVLIPGFKEADRIDCMIGFFSSASLAALAPGLATYVNTSSNPFRLLISPYLSAKDREAIEMGLKNKEEIAESMFWDMVITENDLQLHTLRCLSYLLHNNRLELKIALMKNALFHPKVWIFIKNKKVVAVHGSSNMTERAFYKNFEQISVTASWVDANQRYTAERLSYHFDRLWENKENDCYVVKASQALRDRLIREYPVHKPPTEEDFSKLYKTATGILSLKEDTEGFNLPQRNDFSLPDWLNYKTGSFQHQGQAVDAWKDANFIGILQMATGSGKTITAMIGAYFLCQSARPLLIVIAAPYLPLIEQWCGEVQVFGLKPTNLTKVSGAKGRAKELQTIRRRLNARISEVEVVVVSHDTLCDVSFQGVLAKFPCARLLIADEVHNLGRKEFINNTPDFFEYRLGLSATPVRQYDEAGTKSLFDFFGQTVFQFTLQEAIGNCLVEYDYFVHPIYLTDEEMDDWSEMTAIIKQNTWRVNDGVPDDVLAKLFRDRRKLLETAKGKICKLRSLLDEEDVKNLRYTLIYATDKDPAQLQEVNGLLNEKGILFRQLTAEETRQSEKTQAIIKSFQNGEIKVLTAKRVLDEGVNIPQVNKAFILASTTVERQWVQRRGRLLRTCKATGKTHSEIHDFFVLPPGFDTTELDQDARNLIKSELRRIQEFARAARNAGQASGPLGILDKVIRSVFL